MIKLGKDTGSLVNYMQGNYGSRTVPAVGDGATILSWSDRHPATVIEVATDRQGRPLVTVQEDNYKRTDKNGFSDMQEYEYSRNLEGSTSTWRLENNSWVGVYKGETGRWKKTHGHIRMGEREKYHDHSF